MKRTSPFGRVRIEELDNLQPAMALSGDKLVMDKHSSADWYTPDGERLPRKPTSALIETTRLVFAYRRLPENWRRSPKFYRAGVEIYVSTVYLGLDRGYSLPFPVIWETMVFTTDDMVGEYCWRYATRNAAMAGHYLVTQTIRDSQRARRAAWNDRPTRVRQQSIDMIARAHGVPRKLVTVR